MLRIQQVFLVMIFILGVIFILDQNIDLGISLFSDWIYLQHLIH